MLLPLGQIRSAMRAQSLAVMAEQGAFVQAAVFGGKHGGDVVGDILRPFALLQDLPVDQPDTFGEGVDIARVGIAVDEAGGAFAHLSGERLQACLQAGGIAYRGWQRLALGAVEHGLQRGQRNERLRADLVEKAGHGVLFE